MQLLLLKNCYFILTFKFILNRSLVMNTQIVFDFDVHGLYKVKAPYLLKDEELMLFESAHTSEISDDCVCECVNVDHCHINKHDSNNIGIANFKRTLSEKIIIIILVLTLLFFFLELISGFLLESLTILADAWHMAGDALALITGLVAISLSKKEETDIVSFGWQRTQIIGAFGNGIFLFAVCFITICDAVTNLIKMPEKIEYPIYMLIVGIVGLFINLLGLCLFQYYNYISHRDGIKKINMHSHGHSHSHNNHNNDDMNNDNDPIKNHGHSNSHSHNDLNMRGIFLHILADALGSLVVIGAALLNMYLDSIYVVYADPICSIIFSLFIAKSAFSLIKESIHILMQNVPLSITLDNIRQDLLSIKYVESIHELHVWQVAQDYNVATVHITTKSKKKYSHIQLECRKILCKYNIHKSTIQIEKRNK